MNDKFLFENRPAVRAEFAEDLYKKLFPKENSLISFWKIQRRRASFWVSVIILFVALAACAQKILGTNFHAIEAEARVTIYETNYSLQIPPPDWAYEPFPEIVETDQSLEEFIAAYDMIPLAEALMLLPYKLNFPTYTPEGFKLQTRYVQSEDSLTSGRDDCIGLHWARNKRETFIDDLNLSVCPNDNWGRTIKVAPGKWENIELNGEIPAILVKGSFPWPPPKPYEHDFDDYIRVYWDDKSGASLLWEMDGIGYWFKTSSPEISTKDLIKMAESMIDH